jgi:hypothetical protein
MIPDDPAPARALSPELLVVGGCLGVAVLLGLPPLLGIRVAVAFVVLSFLVGVIAGLGYHVVLHRELAPLPRGWWWSPTRLHARLGPAQRRRVMPWFVVGAAGFVGSLLGCAAFVSALVRL